jgi:hypothetical protein
MTTPSPGPYPVGYEADFAERRSRLSTFFRWLIVLPHLVLSMFLGLALGVTVLVAWFAIVITGRYPVGLHRFNGRVVRWFARVYSYAYLAADRFPPFDLDEHPEYPVRVAVAAPQPAYSRLKAGLRLIVGIPVMLILYALQVVYQVAGFISWFWIVLTGRQHRGLHNALVLGLAYHTRASAYFALLTEDWPPFSPSGDDPLGPEPR